MTIEELARALFAHEYGSGYRPAIWENQSDAFKATYREKVEVLLPLIAAEMAGVVGEPNLVDQVSRLLAAGWRGNPNMSGDDRDFMPASMRRRHDEKTAYACEHIKAAILAHAKENGE